ncbi:MAG TPA: NHL repeat-containing protein [Gammaproteobacteria bacterium]|nr:NHL repeat-containing protein [Gammaproteobacteria bacterium]
MSRAARIGWGLVATLVVLGAMIKLAWFPARVEPPYRLVQTWGGEGTAPGRFRNPIGIAYGSGRVYVADSLNHRIQVFTPDGRFVRAISVPDQGRPMNIAVHDGKVYAADYWNDDVLVFGRDGTLERTFGTPGTAGSAPGRFNSPAGVAVGPKGNVYVAGFYNQRVQELAPDGQFIRQWGHTGRKGYVESGWFNYPLDVAVAADGTLFVADGYNDRIQAFGPDGRVLRKWGGPFAANIRGPFNGWFRTPTGVAIGPHGNVFVADQENDRIQKFTSQGRFLTAFGTVNRGPGYTETAVAVAPDGTVYTTNLIGNRVERWQPAGLR